MNKLRVLHILQEINSGGVERRRLSLSKFMDKAQFELKIICTTIKGPFVKEIKAKGIDVITIGKFTSIFSVGHYLKVIKIIRDFNPHIIHGAVFEGVVLSSVAGFFTRVPIIIIEETSDPQNRSWKANLLMNMFGRISNCAIGVSPAAVEYLKNTAKIKQTKIRLINNGVSKPREVSELESLGLKRKLGILNDELVVGSVGRMEDDSSKRFSDLLKAFKRVFLKNPNTKLVLVGEGRERSFYEQLSKDLGIFDRVIFVGFQQDTALYYSIFDIFTLASAREAFGLVLAEAMLQKLPVVATSAGGMKYIVDDGVTGYLVQKLSINEIYEKIDILLNDNVLRRSFGQAGYKKAMLNYTEERYVGAVKDLYIELTKAKGITEN